MNAVVVTPCCSCDAEVIFVPSEKTGKPMILDAKPTKGVVLIEGNSKLHGLAAFAQRVSDHDTEAVVVDVFTDHHVTCPKAADWKGRTRKDPPS